MRRGHCAAREPLHEDLSAEPLTRRRRPGMGYRYRLVERLYANSVNGSTRFSQEFVHGVPFLLADSLNAAERIIRHVMRPRGVLFRDRCAKNPMRVLRPAARRGR